MKRAIVLLCSTLTLWAGAGVQAAHAAAVGEVCNTYVSPNGNKSEKLCASVNDDFGSPPNRGQLYWCYAHCGAYQIDIRFVKLWFQNGDGSGYTLKEIFGCTGTDCHYYAIGDTDGHVWTPEDNHCDGTRQGYVSAHAEVKFRLDWTTLDGGWTNYFTFNSNSVSCP